jgi:Protein of unknown function DUF262.
MKHTTFWDFLQTHKIEIPIIQRDYAQGRVGKEALRNKFLKDLKGALDDAVKYAGSTLPDNKKLKLDFVYGSADNGNLNPLDGQQRLTTLWLLHWYIAYKTGNISENKSFLKKFSYETRISSREFCVKLSEFTQTGANKEGKADGIVAFIQTQTWFFLSWKQDPTIQAMLNMLESIEETFKESNASQFDKYWQVLTADSPIIFYHLDLEGLSRSDDLYIKMNSRGKPLTSFENFKADLVGFIRDIKFDDHKKPQDTIAHKLDTDWADLFWKFHSPENNIDDIYFAFINRYFFCHLIVTPKKSALLKESYVSQDQLKESKLFQYLSQNGGCVDYNSFDKYKSENILDEKLFESLTCILDHLCELPKLMNNVEISKLFYPSWDQASSFRFIPEYEINPKAINDKNALKYIPTKLTDAQNVVFYAICCYFENSAYENPSFNQWMRVVWNIVDNSTNNMETMIGAMRLIYELRTHSGNILDHLAKNPTSGFSKKQFKEECVKATLIKRDAKTYFSEWEQEIISAEKHPTFKGRIRFLLTNNENTSLSKFIKNREAAFQIFKTAENNEHLWIRATLAQIGSGIANLLPLELIKKSDNWRELINSKENGLMTPFRKLLDKMPDIPELESESILKAICNDYTSPSSELHWLEKLIKWTGTNGEILLNYSESEIIRDYSFDDDNKSIYLLNKSKRTDDNILLSNWRNEIVSKLLLPPYKMSFIGKPEQNIQGEIFKGGNVILNVQKLVFNVPVVFQYFFDHQYIFIGICKIEKVTERVIHNCFPEKGQKASNDDDDKIFWEDNGFFWNHRLKYDYRSKVTNASEIPKFLTLLENDVLMIMKSLKSIIIT